MTDNSVSVGGRQYAYLETGRGPLVLFGHGTFGGKELFETQMQALAEHYRCVSIDWPGHGRSDYPPEGWAVDDLVADIPVLLDALGETSAILIGVSQGGAVFTRVALEHPQRVRALAMLCSGVSAPNQPTLDRLHNFAVAIRDEIDSVQRRKLVEEFTAAIFHTPGFAHRLPQLAALETNVILQHPRVALPLLVGVPVSYKSIEHRLDEITCPTCVVWGADDPRVDHGRTIAATIPGAEFHLVADAGHHVNLDAADRTNDILTGFLLNSVAH